MGVATEEGIRLMVRNILKDEFMIAVDLDRLTPETRLIDELGLDSVQLLELVVSLENEYLFVIEDEELDTKLFESMGTLTKYVQDKISGAECEDVS